MGKSMDLRHLGFPAPVAVPQRHLRRSPADASIRLQDAYDYCIALTRAHYDDLPIASRLLPEHLRRPVAAICTFAHTAQHLADDPQLNAFERLLRLAGYEAKVDIVKAGGSLQEPVFLALADVIAHHALPLNALYDLLNAARLGITKKRFANFAELIEYCRYAANPIGRLLLGLYRSATPRNLSYADAVCSGLQIISLLRDLGSDYQDKGRIYLPQDEMARFGVSEAHFDEERCDESLSRLIELQMQRAQRLLQAGAPLGHALKGRAGLEVRLIILAGMRLLKHLRERQSPFMRPRLSRRDWIWMLGNAVLRVESI
jgi:squalene synthase HpnC